MPEPHTPQVLVLLSSKHNVSEAQAILALRPTEVIVIGSKGEDFEASAERLRHWAEAKGYRAVTVGSTAEGDEFHAVAAMLDRELTPLLAGHRASGRTVVLNATGGTKAATLALARLGGWDAILYKPLGKPPEVVQGPLELPAFPTLTPYQQARLYFDRVAAPKPLPDAAHRQAAVQLWAACQDESSPWRRLEQHAKWAAWAEGRHDRARPDEVATSDVPGLKVWWDRVLSPIWPLGAGDALVLPGGEKRRERTIHRWLLGCWLEDAAVQWLLDKGLPEEAIAAGMQIQPPAAIAGSAVPPGNELDVVVGFGDRLFVVECKYLVNRDKEQEYSYKLSVAAKLGMAKAALLVAREPRGQLADRVRAEQATLLRGPQDLYKWLGCA